jgi:hypothetical protein
MTTTTRLEVLMTLRLHGTPAECGAAADRLRRTPGMTIQDESHPYPDRTGGLVRVYLTADLADADGPDDRRGGRP